MRRHIKRRKWLQALACLAYQRHANAGGWRWYRVSECVGLSRGYARHARRQAALAGGAPEPKLVPLQIGRIDGFRIIISEQLA